MGIIIKARKYLNKTSLLDLYHAFVYPYLTYCIEVWGNMSYVHLDALVKIFLKIVHIITYSPYLAHTDELFKAGLAGGIYRRYLPPVFTGMDNTLKSGVYRHL